MLNSETIARADPALPGAPATRPPCEVEAGNREPRIAGSGGPTLPHFRPEKSDRPRAVTAVEIVVDGRRHAGFYAFQSRMLTVWNPALGSRTAHVGEGALQSQVEALLLEVINECQGLVDIHAHLSR